MSLSPQWLDELRARISLSGVIGRTTRLTKAGHEFKACCPFHNEKSPSFTVNDAKGFYHCFGCGAHGDAIRWMTDQRGLSFMDAVKELAAEAGMEVPAPDPRAAKEAEKRDSLHDVMAAAQSWFVERLASDEGARARAYLAGRGFDAHTMQRFGFGYAPEDRQALKRALGRFPEEMLIEAGLRIAVDDDQGNRREPYDRFRGRLMLPIEDARGRVIAFGGRILDAEKKDAPKYLNSPDTSLFDKGRTLYNLHRAGPASRQTGRLVVVEGYMDVIALAAAGIADAVAPLGTALTERQLELLWRLVETPVLCFDGDAAGQRAAMRAIGRALPMLRPAHSLRIVRLPAGLDPDDLLKREGTAAMERLLAEARPLIDVLWDHEREALPLVSPEDKAGLKARLLAQVETITDPDIRALYKRDLLNRFSSFAFPPRDWTRQGNVISISESIGWAQSQRSGSTSWRPNSGHRVPTQFPGRASQALKDLHSSKPAREAHLHRRLGAALVAGLLRFPELAMPYAETIIQVEDLDPRLALIADATLSLDTLDCGQLETILLANNLSLPISSEWDNLRFPFAFPPADLSSAASVLEQAIRLYAGWPQVKRALKKATDALANDFSEAAWQEQQRLRLRAKEFKGEFKQVDAHQAAA
jgi:DNA primase